MSSKLSIQDIVDLLVANNEISKEEAEKFVVELFSLIEKGLSSDELVKVKDFGTFKLTPIQERESIDVNTQEKIVIPAHRRVSFVPASTLKGLVNKPFAHFETTPLNEGVFIEGIMQDASSEKDDDDEDRIDEEESFKEETTENADSIVTVVEESDSNKLEEAEELSSPLTSSEKEDVIESALAENPIDDNQKVSSEETPIVDTSHKSTPKKLKSKSKLRRYILRWDIAIALFMIVGVGIAYSYYFSKQNLSKQRVEDNDIPKPIKDAVSADVKTNESKTVADSIEIKKASKFAETVKMSPGRTLRLIALDKLGDREFWVYIYLKNKDKIKNPDVVPVGLELVLPNEDEFDMNTHISDHVAKAKKLGDEEMKTFW